MSHALFAAVALLLLLGGVAATADAPPGGQEAEAILNSAVAVWRLGDPSFARGGPALSAHGAVRTGQPLAGVEGEASRARGGGGVVAAFRGGWLSSKGALPAAEGKITPFTIHLRARIETQGAAPLFYWGGDRLSVRLFTRVAGLDPALHTWDAIRQNYLGYAGAEGTAPVLEAEVAFDNAAPDRQRMRLGVPFAMIGTERWHDITLRFSGPKLDLLVDGVLVDEDWPIGNVPRGDTFLFGGEADKPGAASGFHGLIDTAAIWARALSDADVMKLAGGATMVTRRDREILGPQKTALQYFTPRGHNTWVGDTMCFYHDGRFHLLYLFDRRHTASKFGCGGHQYAHATSVDLVTWEHQPLAVPIEEQYETFGTGSMILYKDAYYVFYGMHTGRTVPKDQSMGQQVEKILKEKGETEPLPFFNEGKYPEGASYAVSTDGIHFKKSREVVHGAQNPAVFAEAETGQFLMLGYTDVGLYSSKDLRHWKPETPLIPYDQAAPMQNTCECQCYFEWNGWHYIIAGRTGFWMARNQRGPYFAVNGHTLGNGEPCVPRWDIYDGLCVPMVAPFKDNRRILAGWVRGEGVKGRRGERWGGALVFRELIQLEDGTLGMKWPKEMIPESRAPIAVRIEGNTGVRGDAHDLRVASDTFAYATIEKMPPNARITLRIEPGANTEAFGVCVGGYGDYEGGCELQFLPAKKQAQWGSPRNGSPDHEAPDMPALVAGNQGSRFAILWDYENVSPHFPFKAGDFAVSNVEALDKPFTLDLIVTRDKANATLIDACIDDRRTMITWRKRLTGDRLFLFASKGGVRFRDITVRPLKE